MPSNMIHWEGFIITLMILLPPKMYTSNLIQRKLQKNSSWWTFHKMTGLYPKNVKIYGWKTKALLQIKGDLRGMVTINRCIQWPWMGTWAIFLLLLLWKNEWANRWNWNKVCRVENRSLSLSIFWFWPLFYGYVRENPWF